MSKKLAETWFDVFRQKDVDKLASILAEDFVHESPFGAISSREAYLDLVRANPEAFFSSVIEIEDMLVDGNRVAVRYTFNKNPACDYIYIEDGMLSKIYSYYHYGDPPSF